MKKEITTGSAACPASRRPFAPERPLSLYARYPRLFRPLTLLAEVYSLLLEEPITPGRTLRLLHAQLAAMAFVFPVNIGLGMRLLLLAWAAAAIRQCRR